MIDKAGYGQYFGHGFGHGVGLDVHEAPTANPRQNAHARGSRHIRRAWDIPAGRFGVRIEDVIVLNEDGCTNLMQAPKELLIL